ncbi:MAG: hypothetical protein ACRDRZ_15840 [Pseudonocardiaceae bacterium]
MPAPAAPDPRRWQALVVLCFVQFMLVLDDTAVNVALPTIRDDLGFSTAGLAWVVNAYFLAFGGLLLLFGRPATCSAGAGCSSPGSRCLLWPALPAGSPRSPGSSWSAGSGRAPARP